MIAAANKSPHSTSKAGSGPDVASSVKKPLKNFMPGHFSVDRSTRDVTYRVWCES